MDMCGKLCECPHMATNLELNPELIEEALRLGDKRSKKAVVEDALREYVQRRKQQEIIQLFGTIDYDPQYDYKAGRRKR
jgi:hypothetical protein